MRLVKEPVSQFTVFLVNCWWLRRYQRVCHKQRRLWHCYLH